MKNEYKNKRKKRHFKKGDVVKFKGFEEDSHVMRVEDAIWKTNESLSLEVLPNGNVPLDAIRVGFYDKFGMYLTKDVYSYEIYAVEQSAVYHLEKAIENIEDKAIKEEIDKLIHKLVK